jgi:hypothetical protein
LLVVRHLIPVVVQSDLADGHNFRVLREFSKSDHRPIVEAGAVIGMNTYGRVNVRKLVRQRHGPAAGIQVNGRIDDDPHPGRFGPGNDGIPIAVELPQVEMTVSIAIRAEDKTPPEPDTVTK